MAKKPEKPADDEPKPEHRVPVTVDDMLTPKASSLITEAANFLRAHLDKIRPYYQSINGEIPSMHGSLMLDEAACVFKVQEIAKHNGFALLGNVPTVTLRRALRYGYKRNTGVPMRALESRYKALRRIEKQKQA